MLRLQSLVTRYNAVIAGSRAGRKMHIKPGTFIYVIRFEQKYFCYGFLDRRQAEVVLDNIRAGGLTDPLIAWNFKSSPPIAITRPPNLKKVKAVQ